MGGGEGLYGNMIRFAVVTSNLHGHVDPLLVGPPLQDGGREGPGGPVVQLTSLQVAPLNIVQIFPYMFF